jgi:hypothetical protein
MNFSERALKGEKGKYYVEQYLLRHSIDVENTGYENCKQAYVSKIKILSNEDIKAKKRRFAPDMCIAFPCLPWLEIKTGECFERDSYLTQMIYQNEGDTVFVVFYHERELRVCKIQDIIFKVHFPKYGRTIEDKIWAKDEENSGSHKPYGRVDFEKTKYYVISKNFKNENIFIERKNENNILKSGIIKYITEDEQEKFFFLDYLTPNLKEILKNI